MHTPSTPISNQTAALRSALGPGLQFAAATDRVIYQATAPHRQSRR
ncbi:MAG: hypothetical protein AAGC53_04855 [Actinomycetota bacterium]